MIDLPGLDGSWHLLPRMPEPITHIRPTLSLTKRLSTFMDSSIGKSKRSFTIQIANIKMDTVEHSP